MLENLFSESTGLYFYSAVFQGNMALVALGIVTLVFRLQQIENEISKREDSLMTSYMEGKEYRPTSPVEIGKVIHDIENSTSEAAISERPVAFQIDNAHLYNLSQYKDRLLNCYELRNNLARSWKLPFLWISLVSVIALIGIVFSTFVHLQIPQHEFDFMIAVVVCEVIVLVSLSRYIKQPLDSQT